MVGQVQALLDRRAAALNSRDPDGYLEALDPQAREFERRLAAGSLAAPVGDFSFSLQPGSVQGGFPLDGAQATLNYRYEGLPEDNRFRIPVVYRLERGPSGLVITHAAPGDGVLPMWAAGPVRVDTSEHFLALSSPAAELPEDILGVAERARAEVAQAIPFELDSRFLVVLARDDAEYHRLLSSGGPAAGPRVAQAQTWFEATPEAFRVEGRHILVNLQSLEREQTGPATFKHELGHLALAEVTTPITPGWVAESAAMHLAGQRTDWTRRVAAGGFEGLSFAQLSRSRELGEHDPSGQAAAVQYSYAAGAAGYLIETFGASRYWEFYRSYAAVPAGEIYRSLPSNGSPAAGGELADLAEATTVRSLREFFNLTAADLDAAVRDWIARNP